MSRDLCERVARVISLVGSHPSATVFPAPNWSISLKYLLKNNDDSRALTDALAEHGKFETLRLQQSNVHLRRANLGRLTTLTDVDLSYNWIGRFPPDFAQLVNLERLTAKSCKVYDVDALCSLPKLTSLNLRSNELSGLPDAFGNLSTLRSLNLCRNNENNWSVDGLLPLCRLRSLTELFLSECRLEQLPAAFDKLTSLQTVHLDSACMTVLSDVFGAMTQLQKLFLRENLSLHALPLSITRLSALVELDLMSVQVRALPSFFGNLRALRKLDLSRTLLETLPDSFGQLTSLEHLSMDEMDGLRCLPDSFGRLSSLTRLSLRSTKLPRLPDSFCNLTSLTHLCVRACVDELPADLGRLSSLCFLDAAKNDLTSLPRSIGGLRALQVLDVSHNSLSSLPSSVGCLQSLHEFRCVDNGKKVARRLQVSMRRLRKCGGRRAAFRRRVVRVYQEALLLWRCAPSHDVHLLDCGGTAADVFVRVIL